MELSNLRLAATTLLSARHGRLDRSAVDAVYRSTSEPITRQLIADYAAATNDPLAAYRGDDAIAPSMLLARLVLPLLRQVLFSPALKLNLLRMVHGEQAFRWSRPLRPGERLSLSMRIAEIVETSAGELLRLSGEGHVGDEWVAAAEAGLLVRRAPGAKGPGHARRPAPAGQARSERFRIVLPTTPDQAQRYAAASADNNPIHTSRAFARLAGLRRPILQGMCALALAVGAIIREQLDGDPTRAAGVRARFSHPALPGEPLTLVGYQGADAARIDFELLDAAGHKVLRDAALELA